MILIFESIIKGLALFLGPLFGIRLGEGVAFIIDLERYVTFLFAAACWIGFEKSFLAYLERPLNHPKSEKKPHIGTLLNSIALILSGLIALGLLHLVKERNHEFIFMMIIGALACRIIRVLAVKIDSLFAAHLSSFIETSIFGAASFFVLTQRADWQPTIIGLGYGLSILSINLAKELTIRPAIYSKHPKLASIFFAVTLVGGPSCWTILTILHQLPKNYVFSLVGIAIMYQLPHQFRQLTGNQASNSREAATRVYEGTIIAVTAMLLVVALLLLIS